MKNILNKIKTDPRFQLGIIGIFFAIAAIDTWGFGANSWDEMAWWSKTSGILFGIGFTLMFVRFFILPIGYWIGKSIRNKLNK